MFKNSFKFIGTALLLVTFVATSNGQGLKKKWGWGFGFGANQLYSDNAVTPFGVGGNGLLTYRLTDRLSVSLHAGYSSMKFNPTVPNTTMTTNLVQADLIGDYELTNKGMVRPFIMAGAGGFNFKNPLDGNRYYDGELLLGGGFRVFFNPYAAFTLSGDARYTTGDDLDFPNNLNTRNDAYFAVRGGLTFYMGKRSTDYEENDLFTTISEDVQQAEDDPLFMEMEQGNDPNGESGEYGDFLARLSALETGDTSNLNDKGRQDVKNVKMDEYLRLKSKMDELSAAIEDKETEISSLRENLPASGNRSNFFAPTGGVSSGPIEITDFSSAYETGLNRYYSRRYTEAIGIFERLLERYPNHSLASNCEYWLGECYFNAGDYNRAIETFERVIQYPQSLKKDDALLMIGRSYMALNMNAKAQQTFNRLIREYPNSEFVAKSEQYLRKL